MYAFAAVAVIHTAMRAHMCAETETTDESSSVASLGEEDKLERMAAAVQTILEVSISACLISSTCVGYLDEE
jgi:hypothetical protein